MHRTPASTLFPYTTLFRSRHDAAARGEAVSGIQHAGVVRAGVALDVVGAGHAGGEDGAGTQGEHRVGGEIDRKSTRLNSSHANISYAVFCLKIKKSWLMLV